MLKFGSVSLDTFKIEYKNLIVLYMYMYTFNLHAINVHIHPFNPFSPVNIYSEPPSVKMDYSHTHYVTYLVVLQIMTYCKNAMNII